MGDWQFDVGQRLADQDQSNVASLVLSPANCEMQETRVSEYDFVLDVIIVRTKRAIRRGEELLLQYAAKHTDGCT